MGKLSEILTPRPRLMVYNSLIMKLDIRETFVLARELFEKHWQFYLGILLTLVVVSGLFSVLDATLYEVNFESSPLVLLLAFLVATVLQIGFIEISLRIVRGKKVSYEDLYQNITVRKFLIYLIASSVVVLLVALGMVLLILPGIYLAVSLIFIEYVAVDKKGGPVEAIVESWKIAKGNWWKLFWLGILILLFNLVGLFAFVLGLLITVPISMLAMTSAYDQLESGKLLVSERKKKKK